jgi:hypothetical protein
MSILGSWPISNEYTLPTRFLRPVVTDDHTVVISVRPDGSLWFAAYETNPPKALLFEGTVNYHTGSTDSVYGSFGYDGRMYHVVADAKFLDNRWYIFGFAMSKIGAEDSGGQWDGNRP